MKILIISVLLLTLAGTTVNFKDFVNSQEPQKENLDGGPDSLKIQMQTIIDKYENNENTQIQNIINRFKELSEKNLYNINNIKANIESSLNDMLSHNHVNFRPEDLEYIAFCEDVNNTIPGLSLVAILQKVNASDKNPTTATTTAETNTLSFKQILENEANKIPLSTLKQNPTFEANWNDAYNLLVGKKSLELSKKAHLTEDEKVLFAMEEYAKYKAHTSTRDMQDMRNFLFYFKDNSDYDDKNKYTDEEIFDIYRDVMTKYENKMQNVANLNPGYKEMEVDIDDL